MEDNFDSSAVPSLNIVVAEIFSSCNKNENDVVPVSTLIEFMKPHFANHVFGLTQLRDVLDPNNENPLVDRKTFFEAMRCWTAKINESDSKLFNLSFKESDLFDQNNVSFHQSTPKPSIEPTTTMKNSNDLLDFSNLSPTSFTANMKDNSIGMDKLLFIEERYQELEHKHLNTVRELTLVKSQLATSEEQYAELKQDLDRTNKRLMLEQQVNADLQKSMEHNDDFKEEVCNTKKEKEHVHRMWLLTKKENINLIAQIKSLEYEKEVLDRKLNEMQRKEEQKKKEFADLQTLFSLYEDENRFLKKSKVDLEEKLQETKASLDHYIEVSEILKNKVQALSAANKKKGIDSSELILTQDPLNLSSSSETSIRSEKSTIETIEDLDLSSFSDYLHTFNGQDLHSELQECKFLDNHNKCYVEEHAELLRIVKEHDNCSQIIANKEKVIENISTEAKTKENEYKMFLNKYNNVENDIKCLEEHLRNTKIENEELVKKSHDYVTEITNLKQELDSKNKEIEKMKELERRNLHLIEEIGHIKEKREQDIKKFYELKDAKEILQSSLESVTKEKDDLSREKDGLYTENMNLSTLIEIKRKEVNEMQNLKIKNEELEKEVILMRLAQEQNHEEVKVLSNKLLLCKDKGKSLVEKFNMKIKEQNTKIQFLRDFHDKLYEYVGQIQSTTEATRTKLNLLITYVEDNYVNVKYVQKVDDEDSTSTGSNESSSYHNRSKKGSSSGKKSNYEKQQVMINKLEEKIEELEKELSNEKIISERLKSCEYKMNNLEMEKINYTEEKISILRELEATKYELYMKNQMIRQSEEKYKFDLDNLNQSYGKEMELTKVAQIEAQKNTELKEISLMERIEELKIKLSDAEKEKKLFENMLEKQEDKIITLKKALSDISTSAEETKNFEMLVTEKESMLNFNRHLLLKANNSLKQVENRCLFLELLLDKCKMVLSETVNDVLRSAMEAFNSHRDTLERKRIDPKVIHQLEILETQNLTVNDFTEKEVWIAHNHLMLTSKLLKALVLDGEEYNGCSCVKDAANSKSVSKFTLRPSKLQLHRLPSCDPDISSSMKDNEFDPKIESDKDEANEKQEMKEVEKTGSIVNLGENDSDTNWLDPYSNNLSVQITDASNSSDKCTETADLKKSFRSVGVGDSIIGGQQSSMDSSKPVKSQRKKYSSTIMMISTIVCLFAMCILFVHMECVRNGNETIMCPLDIFISVKKTPPGSY